MTGQTAPQPPLKSLIGQEIASVWRLALPLAAVQVGSKIKGLVDTAIVGRLGETELAGVGLATGFFFLVMIFGIGVMMGFDPLIAQAMGANEPAKARRMMWQSVWLAILLGLALTLPVVLMPELFTLTGIEADVAAEAAIYMRVRAIGLVPGILFYALRGYLQSARATPALLFSMLVGNVFNFLGTWLLVFGGADLPDWTGPLQQVPSFGVAGAAAVTVVSTVIESLILVVGVWRIKTPGPISRRPRPRLLLKAMRFGGPVGLQYSAEVGVFALAGFFAGQLGALEMAAHQVALMLASTTFTVAKGISSAGAVCVGRAIGALDGLRARVSGFVAVAMGTAFMGVAGVAFWLWPAQLASILTSEARVIEVAAPLLFVAAVFQLSDGLQAVGSGILRGLGDTRFSFSMNIAGHYGVGLPISLLLGFGLDMGIEGLWWGLCAGLTVVGVGLLVRFDRLSRRPAARL